jgi:hypothetical protein
MPTHARLQPPPAPHRYCSLAPTTRRRALARRGRYEFHSFPALTLLAGCVLYFLVRLSTSTRVRLWAPLVTLLPV